MCKIKGVTGVWMFRVQDTCLCCIDPKSQSMSFGFRHWSSDIGLTIFNIGRKILKQFHIFKTMLKVIMNDLIKSPK